MSLSKNLRKIEKEPRYPNLGTILMVEEFLEKHSKKPLKISEIKEKLPKQVMHQTLKIILEYLWKSNKIVYCPDGVLWVHNNFDKLEKLKNG